MARYNSFATQEFYRVILSVAKDLGKLGRFFAALRMTEGAPRYSFFGTGHRIGWQQMESLPMDHGYQVVITDLLNDELAPEREVLGDLASVTALCPTPKRSWLAASSRPTP